MTRIPTMQETDLAKAVVQYLQDEGWDVYQEVEVFKHGGRADIIAVIEPNIWVIETKLSYSLDLLQQAIDWRWLAPWVSVAIPEPKSHRRGRYDLRRVIHETSGIGLLTVCRHEWQLTGDVEEVHPPQLNRKARVEYIRGVLRPEHKTFAAAGSSHGDYYSLFNNTKREFVEEIRERPGQTMKELIERLGRMHYASTPTARCALAKWVMKGVIKGVTRRQNGRRLEYYPETEK